VSKRVGGQGLIIASGGTDPLLPRDEGSEAGLQRWSPGSNSPATAATADARPCAVRCRASAGTVPAKSLPVSATRALHWRTPICPASRCSRRRSIFSLFEEAQYPGVIAAEV